VFQGENAAHHILINRGSEGEIDFVGDPRAAPGRISLLHLGNGANDIRIGTLWTWIGFSVLAKTAGDTFAARERDGS
jgi:hypothetical protein